MKKAFLLLLVLLAGTLGQAAVILHDTFSDGDRTDTNLPYESGFWASSPADVTTTPGNVRLDMATSSRRMHTYFAPAGSPISLGVGQKLIATVDIIPEVAFVASTSRNFRFGLFYNDTQYAQDSVGDSGISNGWQDATGYAVQFGLSDTSSVAYARAGKRTNLTGGYTLLGTDAAYTWGSNGGQAANLSLNTVYTLVMSLDYQSASEMLVSFAFLQGNTEIATASLLDNGLGGQPLYTNFDFLLFRLSSNAGTAEVVNFQSIKIEYIPEPATLALLGLGGLLTFRRSR
ncbi:MAG TPA: PEP-CTERM sorting domain-containing protein [Anaerohalosphaeraceae bacterium]|nr:PEP-CTERM sorting domain-containing protein [Anaerohalosphaeraceae bacterium]HOL88761.1 PEP-CTERM sorting domain-containing protein [Anaerohalosphaeraceae bacterium]HPP55946.1 PEP-CTERM sorting domain-containing protein [Anaerohalosphaeraceae bacterium]